jgi:phosphoribosylanthranilate isomerase
MWVKICANTNLADAQLAAELGADAVGFVFAPSKRQVTVEQVAAITPELPDTAEKVGVFHSLEAAELVAAVEQAGLTALQLHSAYRPELVEALNVAFEAHVKLIQVVKVPVEGSPDAAMEELAAALRDPGLFGVLLDAAKSGASGGLGVAFSWSAVARQVQSARSAGSAKLFLAGGLSAENVRTAITTLQPDGVDVASGVEAEPGRKSPERLRAFLQAARV